MKNFNQHLQSSYIFFSFIILSVADYCYSLSKFRGGTFLLFSFVLSFFLIVLNFFGILLRGSYVFMSLFSYKVHVLMQLCQERPNELKEASDLGKGSDPQ